MGDLGWQEVAGDARAVGRALGQAGRAAAARLRREPLWREACDPRHAPAVARMAVSTRARFPAIWDEIEGLAEGLDLPLAEVFAWNCRGDILARAAEGCTSVMLPGEAPIIGHNEDGFPFLRGACFIARVTPAGEGGFTGFCYPGSIPGHAFAVAHAGFVQTVNNIRLTGVEADIPRMVLGRAVLAAGSVAQAVDQLRAGANSGGFHFGLTDRTVILSVEFGGGGLSVRPVDEAMAHANHALHLPAPGQGITPSSRDRQARAGALLAQGTGALAILQDQGGPGLPIRRDAPDDPDEENTLATLVARCGAGGLDWAVHDRPAEGPVFQGSL